MDARVIAATHKNLQASVQEGQFREDLYYRLNVIEIRIPPLRERREDIPLLANHFVERLAHELDKDVSGISQSAMKAAAGSRMAGQRPRTGKRNRARHRHMRADRVLGDEDFRFLEANADHRRAWTPPNLTLQELEKEAIAAAIQRTDGNIKEAAAALGIDRSTLYDKIKRYDIQR